MCLILRALKATDSLVVVRPCGHLRIVRERCVAAAGIFGSASKASKNAAGEFIEPLKDSKSVALCPEHQLAGGADARVSSSAGRVLLHPC